MTMADLLKALFEANYFTLFMMGACTTVLSFAIYISATISATIIAEALAKRKTVVYAPSRHLNRSLLSEPIFDLKSEDILSVG